MDVAISSPQGTEDLLAGLEAACDQKSDGAEVVGDQLYRFQKQSVGWMINMEVGANKNPTAIVPHNLFCVVYQLVFPQSGRGEPRVATSTALYDPATCKCLNTPLILIS